MDENQGISTTLLAGFAAGALCGLGEAILFLDPGAAPAGSGDPWFYVEGFVIYGLCGMLISFAARHLILRKSPGVAALTAPLFAIFYFLSVIQLHRRLFPTRSYTSIPVLVISLALLILVVFLFLKSLPVLAEWIKAKTLRRILVILFLFEAGLLLWYSPMVRIRADKPLRSPARQVPNIVLITMDTTRLDHLSLYGYSRKTTPRLDEFASDGVIFDRAYSVSSWTLPSHASFFTGKLPSSHGASWSHWWLDSSEETMAEILRSQGYATAGFVSGPFLQATLNASQGFQYYDDQLDFASRIRNYSLIRFINKCFPFQFPWMDGQRDGKELTDRALSWLEHYEGQSPFFLFLNYFDPHDPYSPPSPYYSLFKSGYQGPMNGYIRGLYSDRDTGERRIGGKDGTPLTPADYQQLRDLYDGEIRFMDDQIARLLDHLKERNLLSNTLIILASDHGESIGDHQLIDHGHTLYQEQIRIPLILRGPGISGGKRIGSLVRSIDLLPSLLEYLKIPAPSVMQGKSFLPYLLQDQPDGRKYLGEISSDPRTRVKPFKRDLSAVIDGDWKYFWSSNKKQELYDLAADANEMHDIVSDHRDLVVEFQKSLFQYLDALRKIERPTQEIDESTLESIKSNNYFN